MVLPLTSRSSPPALRGAVSGRGVALCWLVGSINDSSGLGFDQAAALRLGVRTTETVSTALAWTAIIAAVSDRIAVK